MNRITITFKECDPAPPKGYRVYWRQIGGGALNFLGNFFSSPVSFLDDAEPGTQYEGIIRSEYNTVVCDNIPWSTIAESGGGSGGSGGGSGSGGGIGNPIYGALESMEESMICANPLEALYLNPPYIIIQPGAYLYYDAALTMPVLGFRWVEDNGGTIFNLDIDDGRILSPTGNTC